MGAKYAIRPDRTATFKFSFKTDLVDGETVVPLDLTGATAKMHIRDSQRQTIASYVLNIVAPLVYVELTPTQTAQFSPHRHHYYVIDITMGDGDVTRLLEGPLYPSASEGVL